MDADYLIVVFGGGIFYSRLQLPKTDFVGLTCLPLWLTKETFTLELTLHTRYLIY